VTVICKFCRREVDVATWDRKPRLLRHTEDPESYFACEGSGELCEVAAEDWDGPEEINQPRKIPGRRGSSIGEKIDRAKKKEAGSAGRAERMDPKLGYSNLPDWTEAKRW
jgi:hypothetical protein